MASNVIRRPEHRQLILDRIAAPDQDSCWIWDGPVSSNTYVPVQSFTVQGGPYTVLIKQFMYQEAYKVDLPPQARLHHCTLNNRCVNPLHNYPASQCNCSKCRNRGSNGRYGVKQKEAWSFEFRIGDDFRYFVFTTERFATLFAEDYIQQLYGNDVETAQKQHGFTWEIRPIQINPSLK